MSVTVFVPELAEFSPLLEAARKIPAVTVLEPRQGYWRIVAAGRLTLTRKELRLRHALWNSALTGGFCGRLGEYSNDVIVIDSEG